MKTEITSKELKQKIDSKESFILLDVRTKDERNYAKIQQSLWILLDELEQKFVELDKEKEIFVYCHHGQRSADAAAFLRSKGFNAVSLKGGIDAWSKEVDGSVKTY